MAVVAQRSDSFLGNQEFVITTVRVMALHTIACLQGFMDILLGCLFQMAIFAKVSAFPYKLPGMLFRFQRFVACLAVTKADGSMHVGFFGVVRMTFFCNARFLQRSWFFHCESTGN